MPLVEHKFVVSDNIIDLFNRNEYEAFVLAIMDKSKKIFPNTYKYVQQQSNGECDYIDEFSGDKFDAKLPFESKQIEMLTDGKKHKPQIKNWIYELLEEASDYQPLDIRDGKLEITDTKLYKIMKSQIEKNGDDESIIFFFPFPIVISCPGTTFYEFATDYLKDIFNKLLTEFDFSKRSIYAVLPSAIKSVYTLRDAKKPYNPEYIECTMIDKYFTYQIVDIVSD